MFLASILDATHLTVLDRLHIQFWMLKYELLLDAVRCMLVDNHLERVNRDDVDSFIGIKQTRTA